MREIILRAYEPRKKEWHYFHIPFDIGKIIPGMSPSLYYENWCESTGLHDKNGKEVFEGDVVRFSAYWVGDSIEKESVEEIEWYENGWNDNLLIGYMDHPSWCEVIGNIYENPELLNGRE